MGRLEGKSALVIGSTSKIGKAIALRYAEEGANVAVTGRTVSAGEELVKRIQQAGRHAAYYQVDITDYASVEEMIARVIQEFGRIDILTVSASARMPEPLPMQLFHETSPGLFANYALSHWISKAYSIRAMIQHMAQWGQGKIVVVTTDAGRTPTVGESLIGAAGAATIQMIKTLSKEFRRFNIRINAIAVSWVNTDDQSNPRLNASFHQKMVQKLIEKQVHPVYSHDVAETALFLACDESDKITGQVISVNGGISVP